MNSNLCSLPTRPRGAMSSRGSLRVRAESSDAKRWISNWATRQAAIANRPTWLPGYDVPAHLDGTLPGDYGFDPLHLGSQAFKLKWYVQAELVHCRFAMLGAAGVLLPELASKIGISWPGANVAWYDAGKFEYFAPTSTLFAVQMFLFSWAELRRLQDIRKPGSVNQDPFLDYSLPAGEVGYPGGIFDPFGWSQGAADLGIFDPFGWSKGVDLLTLKKREIANGRLAMVAFVGFAVQGYSTGMTPLSCLAAHLADPGSTTVWTNALHKAAFHIPA